MGKKGKGGGGKSGGNKSVAGVVAGAAAAAATGDELTEKLQSLHEAAKEGKKSVAGKIRAFIASHPDQAFCAIQTALLGAAKVGGVKQNSITRSVSNILKDNRGLISLTASFQKNEESTLKLLEISIQAGQTELVQAAVENLVKSADPIKEYTLLVRTMSRTFKCAVKNRQLDIVRFLLKGLERQDGSTQKIGNITLIPVFNELADSFKINADKNDLEIMFAMLGGDSNTEFALRHVVTSGNVNLVRELLKRNPESKIAIGEDTSFSMLDAAAGSDHADVLNEIITNGNASVSQMENARKIASLGGKDGNAIILQEAIDSVKNRGADHEVGTVEEGDDQLARALAESAAQYDAQHGSGGGAPAPSRPAPSPTESSEDEDLAKALAASIKSYQTENQAQQQDSSTAGLTPRDIRRMIRRSDTGALQKNIGNGTIKVTDPIDGLSMAYVAAQYGSVEVLNLLLEQGANLDDENGSKNKKHTPLCVAAACGKLEAVSFLLSNGARVNGCESDLTKAGGRSPLYAAVINGHRGVVKALLEAGADVNVTNKKGKSLLRAAFEAFETKDNMGAIIDLILYAKNSENIDLMKLSSAAELEITGQQHFTIENSEETRRSGKARLKIMLEYVFENFKEQRDGFFAAMKQLNPEIVADINKLESELHTSEIGRTTSVETVDYEAWDRHDQTNRAAGNNPTFIHSAAGGAEEGAGEAPPPRDEGRGRQPSPEPRNPEGGAAEAGGRRVDREQ